MGYHESAAAQKDKTLTGADRLLDFVVANIVNEPNGYELWASLDWLAEGINSSRDTARRSLRRLVEKGCLELLAPAAGPNPARWRWIHPDARRGSSLLPLDDTLGVADPAPEGSQITRLGVADRATVPISKEKKEKDLKETVAVSFEDFYATYPRKESRPDAERAWKRATKRATPAAIIAGLAVHAEQWKRCGTERQFIPHPATWLNADRWNDEPTRAGPAPPARKQIETDREKKSGRVAL